MKLDQSRFFIKIWILKHYIDQYIKETCCWCLAGVSDPSSLGMDTGPDPWINIGVWQGFRIRLVLERIQSQILGLIFGGSTYFNNFQREVRVLQIKMLYIIATKVKTPFRSGGSGSGSSDQRNTLPCPSQ